MEQIIIKHIDGTETSFPNRGLVAMITKAEQRVSLMGEDVLSVDVTSANIVRFNIGDNIDVFGRTYTLNQLPSVKKINSRSFNYTLIFESEQYELMDCAWLLPDETVGDSFTGTLGDFLNILIGNLHRSCDNWTLGTYPDESETKTLSFSDSNCLSVLQNLCTGFNVEFQIVRNGAERVLNIKAKIGDEFPFSFHYGRTGGLYNIDRKNNNNKNVVSRLYAFGSSQNIPSTYRHKRLCLPNKNKNQSFIEDEDNVLRFGHRENVHNFDDIKPERVGTVAVVAGSVLKFSDSTMFDLNEKTADGSTKWLIPGTAAKIQFTTGNLAGYSFDVNNYIHSSHTFTINSFTDENGAVYPNSSSSAFQFADGDKYIITDIVLPDSYVADAETKLAAKAREYYDEYCKPHVDYSIQVDSMYLKNILNDSETNAGITNIFNAGDQIHIIDDDLGIDEKIRISQFARDVLNPYSYNLTLSNDVQVSNLQRVIGDLSNINQIVQMNNLTDSARAKRNWRTTQEVLNSVFDPEGDYYTDKIKPNSIETQMLAVGARSQQFAIKGGLINANYGGNPNVIHVDSGLLEHYTIDADGVRVWTLSDSDVSDLDSDTTYYIYAKCDKNGDGGQIVFSDIQYQADAEGGYYYFLCGILSSVMTGADGSQSENPNPSRDVALTYGSTTLNGRYINTGRIQSRNGDTFFDLDSGEIGGNIDFQDSVITETILIKNGKNSEGQTQYCGAISGNANYPVMWVSENNTTDIEQVKDLSNDKCPVKITKNGIGSNIGCMNVADINSIDVSGTNGNIRISSNSIITETAEAGAVSISDKRYSVTIPSQTIVFKKDETKSLTFYDSPNLIFSSSTTRKTVIVSSTSAQKGSFSFPITIVTTHGFMGSGDTRKSVTIGIKLMFQTSADGVSYRTQKYWTKDTDVSIVLEDLVRETTTNVSVSYAPNMTTSFEFTGKKMYLRIAVEFTCKGQTETNIPITNTMTTTATTGEMPTLHFFNTQIANIIAGGGYTCSLNTDNYFKLYPDENNRLVSDMNLRGILKTFNLSSNNGNNYVQGWKWGAVVFIKYKIAYEYKETSALTIPIGFRPVADFDACTYDNRWVEYRTTGVIHPYNLNSGGTLWGGVTYLTNQ